MRSSKTMYAFECVLRQVSYAQHPHSANKLKHKKRYNANNALPRHRQRDLVFGIFSRSALLHIFRFRTWEMSQIFGSREKDLVNLLVCSQC